jgi:prepilin-type processing-associated H-X9-DG protein
MEQGARFSNFSFKPSSFGVYYQDPANRPASTGTDVIPRPPNLYGTEGNIRTLLCPSAPAPEEYVSVWMILEAGTQGVDYSSSAPPIPPGYFGQFVASSAPGRLVLGRTNYLGIGGVPPGLYSSIDLYSGLLTFKSRTKLAKVPDGTSNTLLFGEYAGGWNAWGGNGGIPNGITGAAWACGANYACWGTPKSGVSTQPNYTDPASGNAAWAFFTSMHSNVVNFGFADGSVRPINTNIQFTTWVYLCGYKDGAVVSIY